MKSTTDNGWAIPLTREPEVTPDASQRGYRLFAPLYDLVFGASLQHGRHLAIEALECRSGGRILEVCVGSRVLSAYLPSKVRFSRRESNVYF